MALGIKFPSSPPRTSQVIPLAPGLGQRMSLQSQEPPVSLWETATPLPFPTQRSPGGPQRSEWEPRGSGGSGGSSLLAAGGTATPTPGPSVSSGLPVPTWVSAPGIPFLHTPLLGMQSISGPGPSCPTWLVNSHRRSRCLAGGGSGSLRAAPVQSGLAPDLGTREVTHNPLPPVFIKIVQVVQFCNIYLHSKVPCRSCCSECKSCNKCRVGGVRPWPQPTPLLQAVRPAAEQGGTEQRTCSYHNKPFRKAGGSVSVSVCSL